MIFLLYRSNIYYVSYIKADTDYLPHHTPFSYMSEMFVWRHSEKSIHFNGIFDSIFEKYIQIIRCLITCIKQ